MRDDVRGRLAAEIRETVPGAPGVYAFTDDRGRLLYIGKSVRLRKRMGSYSRQDPLSADPNIGKLVASIGGFAWWRTESELLALLLEDAMIKEYLPPYNTRQKEFAENRYLELTDSEFPACLVVERAPDFHDRDVFGPMKDRYFAARLQEILHESLGIRTCREPEPVGRCLEHDIGRCSGPCRGAVEPAYYRELVAKARDLLGGNAQGVLDGLAAARDRASASRRYEEAARLRDAIETCQRYEAHARFARRFGEDDCSIPAAAGRQEHRFERGALVTPRVVVSASGVGGRRATPGPDHFPLEEAGRRAVSALRESTAGDDRFLADRARIVWNWTRRQGRDCRVRFSASRDRSSCLNRTSP
jgi:excinuclease UvrABC nuclease subunit